MSGMEVKGRGAGLEVVVACGKGEEEAEVARMEGGSLAGRVASWDWSEWSCCRSWAFSAWRRRSSGEGAVWVGGGWDGGAAWPERNAIAASRVVRRVRRRRWILAYGRVGRACGDWASVTDMGPPPGKDGGGGISVCGPPPVEASGDVGIPHFWILGADGFRRFGAFASRGLFAV
jgi:hypothetical protein